MQSMIEDWCDITISKVIGVVGKKGLTTSNPITSLKDVVRDIFFCSTNCISPTEAKLLEREAILAKVELSIG